MGLVPFAMKRMSWRLAEASRHNQQWCMFSRTDAAKQVGVEFRPTVVAEAADLIAHRGPAKTHGRRACSMPARESHPDQRFPLKTGLIEVLKLLNIR
jgi:hypothetical protein